ASYTHDFTATGGGTLIWTATGVPAGLTLSPTGSLTGVSNFTGIASLIVTASDGVTAGSRPFAVPGLLANPRGLPLAVLSTARADATVGQSYSTTLNPSGGLPPYAWSIAPGSSLPPGLSLISGAQLPPNITPGSTAISGAPTAAGTYAFDLIVTDAAA